MMQTTKIEIESKLHRMLNHLVYFQQVYATCLETLVEQPKNDADPEVVVITPEQYLKLGHDGDVRKNAECLGVLEGNRLVSYIWFTKEPTIAFGELRVNFSNQHVYAFNGFTVKDRRGRGLYKRIVAESFRRYTNEGKRGLVSVVDPVNAPPLAAQRTLGWNILGKISVWGRLGHYFIYHDKGCRKKGIWLDRGGDMPVHIIA
jgi:hypothetical protein